MNSQTIAAEIIAADARRRAALVAGDIDQLRMLLSASLVYVHSNALREDHETYLRKLSDGTYRYLAMEGQDQSVRLVGGAALLEGRTIIVPVVANGPPPRLDCRSILIWRQDDDRWKLEYYQGTLLPAA